MEADAFIIAMMKLPGGRDRLVRHGHGPAREIQTGIGPCREDPGSWALMKKSALPRLS